MAEPEELSDQDHKTMIEDLQVFSYADLESVKRRILRDRVVGSPSPLRAYIAERLREIERYVDPDRPRTTW